MEYSSLTKLWPLYERAKTTQLFNFAIPVTPRSKRRQQKRLYIDSNPQTTEPTALPAVRRRPEAGGAAPVTRERRRTPPGAVKVNASLPAEGSRRAAAVR